MKASRRVLSRHIASQLQAGANRDAVVRSLAAYIVEHRLHNDIELIVADIAWNLAKAGHIEAHITTARPLDLSLKQTVIEYVKRIESASEVEVREQVDASLLGGIIIETPSKRFDASIATKLKRLRNA